MQDYFRTVFALIVFTLLSFNDRHADTFEKLMILLETEIFVMPETDVSTLVIREARTIEAGAGEIIGNQRSAGGLEIYSNGNLPEMNFEHDTPY